MRSGWTRRGFLEAAAASALALALPGGPAGAAETPIRRHPRPGDPDWPTPSDWSRLSEQVGGRLLQPASPVQPCLEAVDTEACRSALQNARNPFWLEEQPGATQSAGWLEAWETCPSAYAVAAESAADVAAAVDFARQHRLRIVVKGTGHDYLGRSNAAGSLLVWTHAMRETRSLDAFVPRGAPAGFPGVPALSVAAGTRWLEAYTEATTRNGRYVQGGGCASVGAAGGFPQGGGFGSWSKRFGTGAAGMLEAEVVTADGRVRIANAFQHPDLFWALRGGGGGTFGIVTRLTLMTHPLPSSFGVLRGQIPAASDGEYAALVERLCRFCAEALDNEHWGEQVSLHPDNTVGLYITWQGLSRTQVEGVWADFLRRPGAKLEIMEIPPRDMWNPDWWQQAHPGFVQPDPRGGERFWWAANQAEVSMYWYSYQSRWIPRAAFLAPAFARTLFDVSRLGTVSLHLNKGLSGATEDALRRGRETSVNPVAEEALALAIMASGRSDSHPGLPGHEPDPAEARARADRIGRGMALLRAATPGSGAYANEADYFEEDWQRSFWGIHYPRLLEVKRRYDPLGLFHVHHGVGSEGWSADGMTRSQGREQPVNPGSQGKDGG